MISWGLCLTGLHIKILREHAADPNLRLSANANIPQYRILMREGLIEHKGKDGPYQPTVTGFHLTPRGKFILEMVEQDIAKYLTVKQRRVLRLAVNE
jgi:hypothetical protein